MTDATRFYFALLLGASMSAALLAAMGPWLSAPREGAKHARLGAVVWSLLMLGWPAWAAVTTFQRTFLPWHGAVAGVIALVVALAVPPVSGAVGSLPIGGVVGLSVLRLVGLFRVAAMDAGWLPRRYTSASVAGDVVIALTAAALVAFGLKRRGLVRGWALAGLATLGVSVALQTLEVRPVPAFESLTLAYLTPFFAATYALALKAAGKTP